ncbi:hypothetical protein [Microvirga antarctica]|uniref:hypothetical protein n=1 Tax=Microvirga antarctica TaxID=2819233 RepID=UPI001B30CF0B|nr:hypothetical protein [Microvirga antarctica]
MTELMSDLAPVAAMMFVAACVLWLAWRAIRGLFRSGDGPSHQRADPDLSRQEPVLGAASSVTTTTSTIPDAADVLALKASIDALTRQIGALEKRLSPANTNVPTTLSPPSSPDAGTSPVRADAPKPAIPLVVADRRI